MRINFEINLQRIDVALTMLTTKCSIFIKTDYSRQIEFAGQILIKL